MAGSRLRCSEKASTDTEEKGKGARSTETGELRKGLGLKSPIGLLTYTLWVVKNWRLRLVSLDSNAGFSPQSR